MSADILQFPETAMDTAPKAQAERGPDAGDTVVRGLGIRFDLELNLYGVEVFIETFGGVPQFTNKYQLVGASWNDIATAVGALLGTQAAATGSTKH